MISLNVALPLFGRGAWTGGVNYLRNTLAVIRSRLSERLTASVALSPKEAERFGSTLGPLVDGRLIIDESIGQAATSAGIFQAIVTGRNVPLESTLARAGIDLVFENACYYGSRFGIPVLPWLPDFQHRVMPEMFSQANWWRRDIGFRMQCANRPIIMLSSGSAMRDLERFYPVARERGRIVRFAIDVELGPILERAFEMRGKYGLPEKFFFLPNQFWRHKNHALIVRALARLSSEGRLAEVPPVVMTGAPKDLRHPAHFDDLMHEASAAGLSDHFRYLGLVPYDDVLALNASCLAMINPSLFEGWSTPIEEAKALGTPLILSDLAIHREQAADASFFNPASHESAASVFLEAGRRPRASRRLNELVLAQSRRLDDHAAALLAVVTDATAAWRRLRRN